MSEKFEIDELDSDYGDDEERDYENDKGDSDPKGFTLRKSLPLPVYSTMTTEQLHSLIHEGDIDLAPPYQRDVVWPAEKQSALIESLFLNYYVPPVLFHVKKTKEGPIRICMDGKQRLTSVELFFEGQIPYKDPRTGKKYFYTIPSHQAGRRALVPQKFKAMFAKKTMTIVEYKEISQTAERDIFQRVQMGVTLSAAEKLQAISSPFADWINALDTKHVQMNDEGQSLSQIIKWDTKRGRNFQCLSQIVYCCEHLPERSDPTSKKLAAWLTRVDAPIPPFKKQIDSVLSSFYSIAASDELNYPFKVKGWELVSPVEFVFIAILIFVLADRSDDHKANEIYHMRKALRDEHKDRRFNSRVQASLWEFVEAARRRAPSTAKKTTTNSDMVVAGGKRRRKNDDVDDDYRPAPIKSFGPAPVTRTKVKK